VNILDAPCIRCGREVKVVRRRFGEDPVAVLNAVPDRADGCWFIGQRKLEHMDEDEARKMRDSGFDLYGEHVCPGGGV
jgi:hypothetical protein